MALLKVSRGAQPQDLGLQGSFVGVVRVVFAWSWFSANAPLQTTVKSVLTRYLIFINSLADMPRYYVVTWTLLIALLSLFLFVAAIVLLVAFAVHAIK